MLSLSSDPVLPNANQQLLFHAALDEVNARESWDKWVANNDLDELDNVSARVLPLVFYNLQAQDASENLDGRVKGIYRYWWVRQQQLFNAFSSALGCLKDAGIPVLLFKGAPLSQTVYPNAGARSMGDVDACVPISLLPKAVQLLSANKWEITIPRYANCTLRHEVTLKLRDKIELDMQRYALEACRWNGFNEKVFERATKFEFLGHELLVPSYEDHLLIICSHGMRWSEFPTFQWVYDVTLLLRRIEQEGYDFNWSEFLALCRHTRLSKPTYEVLSYVKREFSAPIPDAVISKLGKQRDGFIFNLEYVAKCSPTSFWTHFPIHIALFTRLQRYAGPERVGIREYCRNYWNISTPSDLIHFWKNRKLNTKRLEA
jgi:hypothetical protein